MHECFKIYFLVMCGCAMFFFNPSSLSAISSRSGTPPSPLLSFADLADKVKHCVVNISTIQPVEGNPLQPFFRPDSPFWDYFKGDLPQKNRKTYALGSGLVINQNGLILTNNHMIEKATKIKVKLDTRKEYEASVIGTDPKTDLALIKIEPDADFPIPAPLGDSDTVRVGDWIIAIGNPFGLGHTVTSGIISAKGRFLGAGPYDDFLQTDVALNPGNSGGPLFNMKGEVIGISSTIVEESQGISFAIPINLFKELLPQLQSGKVVRGWLGVMTQDITPKLAKYFHLQKPEGALISHVIRESPAEKAGLKRMDVIFSFDGKEVNDARTLFRYLAKTPPEAQVAIGIIREGMKKTIEAKVGASDDEEEEYALEDMLRGFTIQELSSEMERDIGLKAVKNGIIITEVAPGSPADEAGIRIGDRIIEANHHTINTIKDYARIMDEHTADDDKSLFLIKREEGVFYIVIESVPGN
ncbi:MAG: Do family serine endopeptidase [bacterium]